MPDLGALKTSPEKLWTGAKKQELWWLLSGASSRARPVAQLPSAFLGQLLCDI